MVTVPRGELDELLQAAIDVAKGEWPKWQEHGAKALARHRGKTAEAVVVWACDVAGRGSAVSGAPWDVLVQETVPFYAALFAWARDGFPHFSLTPDFFSAVAVTDFGDPTDEPLYMPFNAFTLAFPKSDLFDQANRVFVYPVPGIDYTIDGKYEVRWQHYRATLITADPIFTQWPLGWTRKQLLAEDNLLNRPVDEDGVRSIRPEEAPLLSRLRIMLANVMTYIEASGPLPTERFWGSERKPVEKLHPERPLFDVGRVVKLDGAMRQAMKAMHTNRSSWKLAHRYIVRGHWRNQAYGPGRQLHRRQWIAPFWKGPENVVEALSRTYEVT